MTIGQSVGITLFMSIQFKIHLSLLMQTWSTPATAYDSPILKKYILRQKLTHDGKTLYKELLVAPTQELVDAMNTDTGAVATSNEEPEGLQTSSRVEELPSEDLNETKTKATVNTSSSSSKSNKSDKKSKATSASELD